MQYLCSGGDMRTSMSALASCRELWRVVESRRVFVYICLFDRSCEWVQMSLMLTTRRESSRVVVQSIALAFGVRLVSVVCMANVCFIFPSCRDSLVVAASRRTVITPHTLLRCVYWRLFVYGMLVTR